jgi:hypothetical protein
MVHLQVAGLIVSNVIASAYPQEKRSQRPKAAHPTVSSTFFAASYTTTMFSTSKLMQFPAVQFDLLFAHTPSYPDEAPLIKLSK